MLNQLFHSPSRPPIPVAMDPSRRDHHHHQQQRQHVHPHPYQQPGQQPRHLAGPSSSSATAAATPDSPRGVKRQRADLANCDCDDIDVPLSKRINGLNIEQPQGGHHHHHHHGHQPHHEPHQPAQAYQHGGDNRLATDDERFRQTFQENYPYAPNSTYYSSNHMLYHLNLERQQRQQQLQQQQQLHGQPGLHRSQSNPPF